MPDTGAPWNIPYVEAADLVSDWPADSLALANAIDAGLDAAAGLVQVVVATDSTDRTTTSTSYVDSGISVTITPTDAANRLILVWAANVLTDYINALRNIDLAITTSADVALQGAESARTTWNGAGAFGAVGGHMTVLGNVIAGSTSAQTFKGRYKANAGTARLLNATTTGMLLALEVKP